jgi:hypothetical protein
MKGTLIRYKAAPERANENQQLIEKVFAELHEKKPDGVRYMVLRLADGTFTHFVVREPDRANAITDLASFQVFQRGIKDRCVEAPQPSEATLVGNYGMLRD